VCALVYDPWERELPGTDDLAFTDGRTSLVLRAGDPRVRAGYRRRFDDHVERMHARCRTSAALLVPLCTADGPLEGLRRGLAAATTDA
jgi:hypothetical protein